MIIDAIVPAYNEERTIGNVISVLKEVKEIHQIIVVNDHSKDATSYIAKQMGVIVIDLPNNLGKGGALKVGAEYSQGDYLSLIHILVEFKDHSILAQMAFPDMRIPISYALNYPHRRDTTVKSLNFDEIRKLTFFSPDYSRDVYKRQRVVYDNSAKTDVVELVVCSFSVDV